MELLKVSNITKVYNTGKGMRQFKALNGVSFDVHEGEFVAIMGPSGSGKTTLLNILATLDKPTCGEVLLDGHSFNKVKDSESARFRREHLGFVFQDFNLLDTFSLKDNILLPLVLAKTPIKEMELRLAPIAKMLSIEEILDKINELETRLKKIELRLQRLESSNIESNYNEPDTNLYMI